MNDLIVILIIIAAIIFGIVYALPYILIGLVIMMILSIIILYFFNPTKKLTKDITEEPFTKCSIKPDKQYTKEELKELLGLFDTTIFKQDFSTETMNKGEIYFHENRIKNFQKNENTYTCKINGTQEYDVSFEMDKSYMISNTQCTCKGFETKHNCKHIYALLYSIKASKNKEKIITALEEVVSAYEEMINKFAEYIKSQYILNSNEAIEATKKVATVFKEGIQDLEQNKTEEYALKRCELIYNLIYESRTNIANKIIELNKNEPQKSKTFSNKTKAKSDFTAADLGRVLMTRDMIGNAFGEKELDSTEKFLIALRLLFDDNKK